MRLKFIGTGTSHGVPAIGCSCETCKSSDPKDTRYRTGLLIEESGRTIVIDTPAEFRVRTLEYKIEKIDALLITHAHADHIAGLDDIRRYNELSGNVMPLYCSAQTAEEIKKRFAYIFEDTQEGGGKPRVQLNVIEFGAQFDVCGLKFTHVPVLHGEVTVSAYRLGNMAYVTDISHMPAEAEALLQGLDVLILDALRHRPHPTHFSLHQAMDCACRLKAKNVYFTHIAHSMKHDKTNAELPEGMQLAYDGLEIKI